MSDDTKNHLANTTPPNPYLIRAFYEWMVDNALTPHIVVNTNIQKTLVPNQYIKNGEIILNISPKATRNLSIGNDALECKMQFDEVTYSIYVPIAAILAIYALENAFGMHFAIEDYPKYKKDPKIYKPKLTLLTKTTTENPISVKSNKKASKPSILTVMDGGKTNKPKK